MFHTHYAMDMVDTRYSFSPTTSETALMFINIQFAMMERAAGKEGGREREKGHKLRGVG